MSSLTKNHYQVWITSYPLDGNDPASNYDKGYQPKATFATIEEAVGCYNEQRDYAPVITKLVTWKTTIKDVTELESTASETSEDGGTTDGK
jgi:hypothetical protein